MPFRAPVPRSHLSVYVADRLLKVARLALEPVPRHRFVSVRVADLLARRPRGHLTGPPRRRVPSRVVVHARGRGQHPSHAADGWPASRAGVVPADHARGRLRGNGLHCAAAVRLCLLLIHKGVVGGQHPRRGLREKQEEGTVKRERTNRSKRLRHQMLHTCMCSSCMALLFAMSIWLLIADWWMPDGKVPPI